MNELKDGKLVGDKNFPVSNEKGEFVGHLIADKTKWSTRGTPVINEDGQIVGTRVSPSRSYAGAFIATQPAP